MTFNIPMLERLEEIICPRCGGSGLQSDLVADELRKPCDVCNGERHVWRLRTMEAADA